MEIFNKLYDETEKVSVRFVGFTTDAVRYDFGIVHTNMFFGKPLVFCMQTGRSTLLDADEMKDIEYLQAIFQIKTAKEAEDLSLFFSSSIPLPPNATQYE